MPYDYCPYCEKRIYFKLKPYVEGHRKGDNFTIRDRLKKSNIARCDPSYSSLKNNKEGVKT